MGSTGAPAADARRPHGLIGHLDDGKPAAAAGLTREVDDVVRSGRYRRAVNQAAAAVNDPKATTLTNDAPGSALAYMTTAMPVTAALSSVKPPNMA